MSGILSKYIPADQRIILRMRPSSLFILMRAWWMLVFIGAATGLAWFGLKSADAAGSAGSTIWIGIGAAAATILWQWLQWLSCLYVLTDERMLCVAGAFGQSVTDVPLCNVCNVVLVRSFVERLLGLGTLGAATAGTSGYELVWVMLSQPNDVLAAVRRAVDSQQQWSKGQSMSKPPPMPVTTRRHLVIGLVGGVGAGKSEVAKLLGEHGYVVIDSDKEAKAALDRPQVREELVKWWGPKVLTPEGRIDRHAVASIVFSDQTQRARLEGLVHPLVKAGRAELVARATSEGKAGVVVDAPLLFEAGSDKECDVVVFVDSPRARRAERVQASRGWDEAELLRRENAQLPLEEKQRRSDVVVVNDSTPEILRQRVEELVKNLATFARPTP